MFKDAIGRQWQLSTIQLDFNLPERFELEYTNNQSGKSRPVVIHRAMLGSVERFMGIMIEHFAGTFPTWLSPVQVAIVPVNESQHEYAQKIYDTLIEKNIPGEMHNENDSLGKRINGAKAKKVPYVIVIGDKEKDAGVITVETRGEKLQDIKLEDFISKIEKEIKERTLN